ncbi:MAG: SWIM zinc finger family protein [Limnospira sp.]
MQATTAEPKAAAVPDGLHHRRGVEYLAAAAGMEPDRIGAMVVFGEEMGFSEITGFIKSSNGRGYYRATLTTCTCPSFKFRGGLCKHQKILAETLHKRGERVPAAVELSIGRPEQLPYPARPGARWEPRKMTSEELEARKARIDERDRQRAEERAPRLSSGRKGFVDPDLQAVKV